MLAALVVLAIVAAACGAYGIVIERRWYRLRTYDLAILPSGGPDRLDVLHLSDLHVVRGDNAKRRFLAGLPRADVTVVTGDVLGEPEAVENAVDMLQPARGTMGSWFVLGSNDYFEPKPLNYLAYFRRHRKHRTAAGGRARDLIAQLTSDGWIDLTNSRRETTIGDLDVELLGLDDAHIRWHDLRVAPRETNRFGVAVMHSPDSAPETAALGYDLMFAGHTHGGQVCLPLVGALVTNCSMPPRLVAGLIRMGPTVLHTSRGLGTSKYAPFRFCCRPEATILRLTRKPEPATPALH
ncbi:MAG TPA: metallophosphoesterase [Actinomycetota bacterium]|nr:metallophosphoesterase [Actinomycetota bacterium]